MRKTCVQKGIIVEYYILVPAKDPMSMPADVNINMKETVSVLAP